MAPRGIRALKSGLSWPGRADRADRADREDGADRADGEYWAHGADREMELDLA